MTCKRCTFVSVHLILLIHTLVYRITEAKEVNCEVLTIPMCKNLGYNTTYMPNKFNHETQEDAELEIDKFSPFVDASCSPVLQLFLCSLYAPACDKENGKELLPCRSVCVNATAGCLKLMKDFGVKWPEKMESCNLWPRKSDNKSCLAGSDTEPTTSPSSFKLTDKSRSRLKLSYDILYTKVTLTNSVVSFVKLENTIVTLMLVRNTSVSFLDLIDAKLNLLTLTTTSSVAHFKAKNTILNSLTLISTHVSHFRLTDTNITSLTLTKSDVSHFTLTNCNINSLTLTSTNVSHFGLTNCNINSFTLINCRVSHFTLTNITINSFTRTNTKVSRMWLTNTDLSSVPSTDITDVVTSIPPTDTTVTATPPTKTTVTSTPLTVTSTPLTQASPTKENSGVIIVVSKIQISSYVLLLCSIIGFLDM